MDRISRLPDEILHHILSFLPTKHAVATSILSSRWTDLWVFLPVLDFDDSLYLHPQKNIYTDARQKNLFMEFVDVVLSLNHSPNLSRFRLCINVESQVDLSDTNEWIRTILQRNVVELHLSVTCRFTDGVYNLRIPPSKSLQALKICSYCGLHMPTSGEFFPNLRTFEFEGPFEDIEDELPIKFFTTLPRLEKLSLSGEISPNMGSLCLNIVGPSLKSLIVNICEECEPRYADMHLLEYERDHCYVMILIDAPHLEFLHLRDGFFVSYSIKNLATNCKVKLDVNLVDVGEMITYSFEEYQSEICMPMNAYYPNESSIQLMKEICNVECLSISASITRALMNAIDKNLPTFHHLTKLELTLHRRGWNLFLHWLHNSPNLQFLVLNNQDYDEEISTEDEWSFIDCVPACLLLHLKEVEIKRLGKQQEDKVLTYLRTNARVLQKITLNSHLVSI